MTTVTKEMAEAQIKQYEYAYRAGAVDDGFWSMDYTRTYITQLEAEIVRKDNALRFYAERKHIKDGFRNDGYYQPTIEDYGDIATAALDGGKDGA